MNATGAHFEPSQSALDGDPTRLIDVDAPADTVDVEAETTATRNRALLSVSAEAVHTLDADSLLTVQGLLQHGANFGRWQSPRRWMPLAQKSLLDVDLRGRTVGFLPGAQQTALALDDQAAGGLSAQAEDANFNLLPLAATRAQRLLSEATLTLVRYLVVCRMGPSGIGRKSKGRALDPSTLARVAYQQLPQLMAIGLSKRLEVLQDKPEEGGLFCRIAASDLERFSAGERFNLESELKRMQMLSDRGMWDDVASLDSDAPGITSVAGDAEEVPPEPKVDPHLPLPDDYVAEMGRKSLWLIKELGPSLLQVTAEIREIWMRPDDQSVSPARIAQRRDEAVRKVLAEHAWLTPDGQPIVPPPFALRHGRDGKGSLEANGAGHTVKDVVAPSVGSAYWHPRTLVDVIFMLKLVQMSHFFVVGLSMGARKSELTTLERNCVQYASNGLPYASGRTWKLVERHEGAVREWVLPDLAMQAIEQQLRVVTLIDDIGTAAPKRAQAEVAGAQKRPTHLWAQLGGGPSNRAAPLTNTRAALRAFATYLGMDADPGGQGIRVHRFRKTIARLAALALAQAPKILKDVFGHKSIEMTLYYILTDKDLQVDVERVTRELRVMRAKETVEAMVMAEETPGLPMLGGFGGPAAIAVASAISVHRERLHRRGEDWGAESAYELAEILTLQGKAWQLVRPGIVCTKFPGTESGPCNKSKGAPEPARCQSHCKHRLEEAFLRDDVDASIGEALAAYTEAGKRADDLLQALWADQVRVHLGRFPDLKAKWMEDASVRTIAERATEETS